MFTGIIESQSKIQKVVTGDKVLRISVEKPSNFNDISIGDSISVDGICLTVEKFDAELLLFAVGEETLKVTSWEKESLANKSVNLERPLKVDSRLHGHWVTGHVDKVLKVIQTHFVGENKIITVELPVKYKKLVIEKGSVTINGVALTINEVTENDFSVCIIPETLQCTNLKTLEANNNINIEFDYLAKIVSKSLESFLEGKSKPVSELRGYNA